MSKNRRNFIIGNLGSAVIFFIGVIYVLIPSYYGRSAMNEINPNNLFLSMMIIYTGINLGFYCLIGPNPNHETIFLSIASTLCGIINLVLGHFIQKSLVLAISVLIFTIAITIIRLFTVDYYHDRNDAYFYIEGGLCIMFFITGFVLSISLFNDPLLQTIELGFFTILIALIESMKVSTKCLLKAPRFLGKIKF